LRPVALTLLAVLLWNVLWYWRSAGEIAAIWWRSETFGHGLVVLPVVAWLVWRRREAIGALQPQPVAWLALPVALAATLWLLGELVSVAGAAHTGFVLLVVISMVAALGWRLAKVLAFPLLFLFFGLPVGEFLLPDLMKMTADFTVGALRLSGIPVYQEGMQIVIPSGSWSVVEACSGIRYLIASLMLGSLYAWLRYGTLRKRLAFMLVAIAVPLVANWVRAYLIVLLGHVSGNKLASGVDHLIYGWVFFGIVIGLMFWIGQRWGDPTQAMQRAAPAGPFAPTHWWRLLPVALVSVAFVLVHAGFERQAPSSAGQYRYELAAPAAGWRALDAQEAGRIAYRAHYEGARSTAEAVYAAPDGGSVLLQTAFFVDQHKETEALASLPEGSVTVLPVDQAADPAREGTDMLAWINGLVASDDANRSALREGPLADSALGAVRSAHFTGNGVSYLIWQWYVIDGKLVVRDWEVKLRLAFGRLAGHEDASMVFVLATPDDEGDADEERLSRFVADHQAALRALYARAARAPRAVQP
jgi:exosortase A